MGDRCVHTVYSDGRWKNKVDGASPLPGWYERQEIAAEAGRAHAMRGQVEHLIRNQDGTVAQRVSYEPDRLHPDPLHDVSQPEVKSGTGLSYAMRRLAQHLLLHDSSTERQEPWRGTANRPGRAW